MKPSLLDAMTRLERRRVPYALCIVADAKGSVPGKPGFAMVVSPDEVWGTIGGAGLEERVKSMAREALRSGRSGLRRFDLAVWKPGGLDSVCGGTVDVAIQVNLPRPHLLLVGGGHVAKALADVAALLEWRVTVVDDRPEYGARDRFPRADDVLVGEPAAVLRKLDLGSFSHAYVLGYDHKKDVAATRELLADGGPAVVGVIGSEAKRRSFVERLDATPAALARLRCPVGIDVGATTPEEIAVAIAAEVVRDGRATGRDESEAP